MRTSTLSLVPVAAKMDASGNVSELDTIALATTQVAFATTVFTVSTRSVSRLGHDQLHDQLMYYT